MKNCNSEIYHAVALLHAEYINKGFLSSLGVPFLTLLYEAIDSDEKSVLLVEKVDDVVVGYVSGTSSMRSIYKQLLMRLPRLLWLILPSFFSLSRIRKILEVFFFTKQNKCVVHLPHEELLSIVVTPARQGKGYAEKLFVGLCYYFGNNGANGFHIVVGNHLYQAHSFYLKLGSEPIGEVEVHKGERSTVYLKRLNGKVLQ